MDDVGRLWLGIGVCAAVTAVTGFFSMCEYAAVEFNDAKLKKLAEENNSAKNLLKLLERPNKLRNISVISRTVMAIVVACISAVCFFTPLCRGLCRIFGISYSGIFDHGGVSICAFLILLLAVSLFVSVFGSNLPKKLVASGKVGDRFILRCQGLYRLWVGFFNPLEAVNDLITKGILRIFGVKNISKTDSVTEEEILLMVDAVNETGAIEESQAEMISNIFEFDDVEISEVMTHRTEVLALKEDSSVTEAVKLALEEGVSRIPIFEENIDNITGVVFVKDLLRFVLEDKAEEHTVKEYMREILFVPESNSCREVFNEFTGQKIQIAVAVDEYGGTAGIITMEDLLETIVGNIQDEYDNEAEEVLKISDGEYEILGSADYEDAAKEIGLSIDEDEDYETMGGFVIDKLGYIPKEGETPETQFEGVKFKVLSAKDNKIVKLKATVQPELICKK